MRATNSGSLNEIPDCTIEIPSRKKGSHIIQLNNLPDVSDSKTAVYNNETIMGRSFPLYTYSHSGDRSISLQLHFFIVNKGDGEKNLEDLRWIQSAAYPRKGKGGLPYLPPPVCQIRCGDILATKGEAICVSLQSYSVRFPTEVAWDEKTYCPYRFDVDTQWLAVYTSSDLPYQNRIISLGR